MAAVDEPFIKDEAGEDDHELASSSTALSNTCKAIIGSGCIALSDAFRQSGWVVGDGSAWPGLYGDLRVLAACVADLGAGAVPV